MFDPDTLKMAAFLAGGLIAFITLAMRYRDLED